jgi:S1-C subfamily serine protease
MRLIAVVLATATFASPAAAQVTIMRTPGGFESRLFRTAAADQPKAVIGITTTGSATNRDTLGVLVSSVRAGSPAEKAGIEEGNRIAAINGVSLKLAAADVGEYDVANSMTRRLTRELEKLKPGDEVELRVYASGQTKTVKVKTVAPDDLYDGEVRRRDGDRATLGLNIAMTGSARDTLGVFVMSVEDDSPAAKAGIEEGSRIASINGVDLRGKRHTGDDDIIIQSSSANRLERELGKVKPGDDVDLRVYFNGQTRTIKVKTARLADIPRHSRSVYIMGGDSPMPLAGPMPAIPPMPPTFDRMPMAGLESARRALESVRAMPRLGNRVVW